MKLRSLPPVMTFLLFFSSTANSVTDSIDVVLKRKRNMSTLANFNKEKYSNNHFPKQQNTCIICPSAYPHAVLYLEFSLHDYRKGNKQNLSFYGQDSEDKCLPQSHDLLY